MKFGDPSGKWSETSSLLRAASVQAQKHFGRNSLLASGLRTIGNALKGRTGMTALGRTRLLIGGTAKVGAIGLMAAVIIRTGDCLSQQVTQLRD